MAENEPAADGQLYGNSWPATVRQVSGATMKELSFVNLVLAIASIALLLAPTFL